jgi:ankyrin repeat protein
LPRTPADIVAYQLRWAVGADAFDRVKLLVENGADVNRPHSGVTPYTAAVSNGHQEIAEYLVEHGASRIAVSLSPAHEFAIACNRADADRARELIACNPSLLDVLGDLLTEAAEEGRVDSIRLLVELGVDLNGKPGDESPLHCAARAGQLETAKLLVELGADVHARDRNFNGTPLRFANYKGQRNVVEYLLQFATICEAVEVGGLDRVRALLRENPECVRVRDKDGRTPLHYPYRDTQHGAQIIELLIAHGADPSAKDNEGRTPADQMLQKGRRDLAEVLRRHDGHSA